jgi:vitamin B12 transporter
MKHYYLIFILILSFAIHTNAQKTALKGRVIDNKNKPIRGANISLVDSYDGGSSDSLGNFKFTTRDTGIKIIQATFSGYTTMQKTIVLNGNVPEMTFIIKEKVSELKAITISAGSFEASDDKKATVLKPLDIVTTAGSNGDNFAALKTLPGTQQNNDREGLFVRGGTAGETQTFIDGTLVRNAFLTGVPDLGARGRFNPFLFKGTNFSAGGYSALYGGALSSAVILETEDMPDKSQGFANLSTVGLGLGFLKLNKKKNASFSIALSQTNLAPYFKIVKQNITYKKAPIFYQVDISARKQIGKTGILKLYAYYNTRELDISRNDINSYDSATESFRYLNGFALNSNNLYANVSFKNYIATNTKIYTGISASTNVDKFDLESQLKNGTLNTDTNYGYKNNASIQIKNSLTTGKFYVQQNIKNVNKLRLGGEVFYYTDGVSVNNAYGSTSNNIFDTYSALFAEGEIYVTNNLVGKIGLRTEYDKLLKKWNTAPRLSMAFKLDRHAQLNFAYGDFYQKPDANFMYNNNNLQFMKATHWIANYIYQKPGYYLRLEAYNKQYSSLIKTDAYNNIYSPNNVSSNGIGYARGIELYYRDQKTIKGLDYWISYSYIDTKRNFLNYQRSTQPDFVASHIASLVVKKFWTKKMFGLNGTYTFSTGRPYINYNTFKPNGMVNDPELFLKDYAPAYHNVGISANYLKTIGKTFNVFVISISNPFYFKQTFGYNYSQVAYNKDGTLHREAITPAAPAFFFLGVFTSWGTDKTDDAVNNNL